MIPFPSLFYFLCAFFRSDRCECVCVSYAFISYVRFSFAKRQTMILIDTLFGRNTAGKVRQSFCEARICMPVAVDRCLPAHLKASAEAPD